MQVVVFPDAVTHVLQEAGWGPGRWVDPEPWLSAFEGEGLQRHPAASAFLGEFGGLAVEISGTGVSRAREPFELDPMLCRWEGDRFAEWSETLGKSIFPVGELDHGRFFLGIDESSEIYLVETWVASFGRMPEAMIHLILGVNATLIHDGSD